MTLVAGRAKRYTKSMKKHWNRFKQLFSMPTVRREWTAAADGISRTCVVDLNTREQKFVDKQTQQLLLLRRAQQLRQDPQQSWVSALPRMPHRSSTYALYTCH